ncbi:hypothetical protein CVT24_010589 [Panaeolus cyanescens]|uniref:Uncharacterized protein n=1 Tax=Panaeolus cyanescens TaxID=181874 RepID=A0A409X9S1_9AGAR|nr:hypothetical protein CVT24_010589 [Panaeolus cyanescens]
MFPSLPERHPPWPASVTIAAGQIYNGYITTTTLITSGNFNKHRISAQKQVLYRQIQPLLEAISQQEPALQDWIAQVCAILLELLEELDRTSDTGPYMLSFYILCYNDVKYRGKEASIPVKPYTLVRTGKRGRPAKKIHYEALEWAATCNMSQTAIARLFGVNQNLLAEQMKEAGFPTDQDRYTDIRENDLDDLVREVVSARPDTGLAYLTGQLRAQYKLRVKRWRLKESLRKVDQTGTAIRRQALTKKPRGQ